eukprot:TRINITY_DN10555_c0_g1_i1.p1 TRINITY_DN10555_c0_g1~~TRINITY_DN10555_c0_g1_i1.p1  ORF type:complete len:101 (+),score=6.24 TRINITY_DN10555_c0_g1_i1:587-889(+)
MRPTTPFFLEDPRKLHSFNSHLSYIWRMHLQKLPSLSCPYSSTPATSHFKSSNLQLRSTHAPAEAAVIGRPLKVHEQRAVEAQLRELLRREAANLQSFNS